MPSYDTSDTNRSDSGVPFNRIVLCGQRIACAREFFPGRCGPGRHRRRPCTRYPIFFTKVSAPTWSLCRMGSYLTKSISSYAGRGSDHSLQHRQHFRLVDVVGHEWIPDVPE